MLQAVLLRSEPRCPRGTLYESGCDASAAAEMLETMLREGGALGAEEAAKVFWAQLMEAIP